MFEHTIAIAYAALGVVELAAVQRIGFGLVGGCLDAIWHAPGIVLVAGERCTEQRLAVVVRLAAVVFVLEMGLRQQAHRIAGAGWNGRS